jgi:alpha-D-xyloside xylohydrolase
MPYVYAQAALASRDGHPMLRTLFFEYPEDPTSWLIEDQYLFGTDILVAPLMENLPNRNVYLPPGLWTDYQTGETYAGAGWHRIRATEIPAVMLVRDGVDGLGRDRAGGLRGTVHNRRRTVLPPRRRRVAFPAP